MLIPDEIRRCAAFVGYHTAQRGDRFAGTAFFVAEIHEGTVVRRWIVTASHVLNEMRGWTSEPDTTLVRVNFVDHSEWLEFDRARWMGHADAARDISVLLLRDGELERSEVLFFPLHHSINAAAVQRWGVGPGDEILITGLFQSHLATQRNVPIVRIGSIAAMPEEPVSTGGGAQTPAYLIEARSIGGLSGSPAFLSYGPTRLNPETGRFQRLSRAEFGLLGLVHGHFKVTGDVAENAAQADGLTPADTNSGIAIVIPADSIREAIEQAQQRAQPQPVGNGDDPAWPPLAWPPQCDADTSGGPPISHSVPPSPPSAPHDGCYHPARGRTARG